MPSTRTQTKLVYDNRQDGDIELIISSNSSITTTNISDPPNPKNNGTKTTSSGYSSHVKGYCVGLAFKGDQLATGTVVFNDSATIDTIGDEWYSYSDITTRKYISFTNLFIDTIISSSLSKPGSTGYYHISPLISEEKSSQNIQFTVGFPIVSIIDTGPNTSMITLTGYTVTTIKSSNYSVNIIFKGVNITGGPSPSPSPTPSPTPDPDCDCDYNAIAREMRSKHTDLFALIKR